MSWFRSGALKLTLLLAVAISAICGGEARASSLGLALRVQQDFYTPLVPVTKNFRTCFKTDAKGRQTLGICTDEPAAATDPGPAVSQPQQQQRRPASGPSPTPNSPKKSPRR